MVRNAFVAQCPRCETHSLTPASDPRIVVCDGCGKKVHRATLLQQVAAAASLTADVLAERNPTLLWRPMAN